MEPLRNPRHEKFAQCLFQGMSANRAYAEAGYSPHDGNCIRLRGNERIKERLAYLQGEASKSAKVTIESINRELDEAIAVAKGKHQAQAMVSASSMKAKLAGLLIERTEVGTPGSFDNLCSIPSIADKVLEELTEKFKPIDERDRQALIAMYQRHVEEARELIDSISARPITAERVDTRKLSTPWQQLETRSAPARLRGNGAG